MVFVGYKPSPWFTSALASISNIMLNVLILNWQIEIDLYPNLAICANQSIYRRENNINLCYVYWFHENVNSF